MAKRCRNRPASHFPPATLLVLLVWAGCATNSAPRGWLEPARPNSDYAFGGWIEVTFWDAGTERQVAGELIAVGSDSIYVLPRGPLAAIARGAVAEASLTGYDSQADQIGGWTAIMAASSLSHGFGAIVTIPAWILIGSICASSTSGGPVVAYDGYATRTGAQFGGEAGTPSARIGDVIERTAADESWKLLPQFARFPQGLPPGLDRNTLEPKPSPPPADHSSRSE